MDKNEPRKLTLEERLNADQRLKPILYMMYNCLDIVKLAAGGNEELAQAGRNLVYLSWTKWGWALLRNLERSEPG